MKLHSCDVTSDISVTSRWPSPLSRLVVAGFALVAALAATPSYGQLTTWVPTATGATWSTVSNWSNGLPTSSGTAQIGVNGYVLLDTSATVGYVTLTNINSRITGPAQTGNAEFTLTINNGLTQSANVTAGTSYIRARTIALGGNQSWDISGSSGTNTTGAVGFTITGSSNPVALNTLNLGGYTLTKAGAGQLSFGNVSIGNGSISIDNGSVRLSTGGLASSGTSMQVIGTGTIAVKSGAALILNNGGSSTGAFDITKAIRMEGAVGTPSTLMYAGGSDNLPGTIAAPIEWAGVANLTNFWTGTAATTNATTWIFSGNWTGSGTVNLVTTSTSTPSSSVIRKTTISGSNAGFSGIVNNQQSAAADVRFASSNAGSANAEWQLNNPNASYKLAGLNIAFGALSGTAGSLGNYGVTTTSTATIGGKGIDSTFSGLIIDGSTAPLAVVKTGTGTLTLNGTSSYTGGTTVSAGRLRGTTSGIQGAITNNATVEFSQATSGTYAGIIGGSGSLTKSGVGSVTLSGANTFSGLTDVQAGALVYGVANAVGSGDVQVSGGTLDIATFTDSVGTVMLTGGSIVGTTGVLSGTAYDVRNGSISAVLGGVGAGLTKSTVDTVTLSGINTFSGVTAVNAGTLKVDGSIAGSSGVGVASGATLGGSGAVSVVSGAGLVSPGNSPGILTATSIDPSTGMDFAFELTGTGSPDYAIATNSVNDVLRLTAGTPSLSALSPNNTVSVYFGSSILSGDVFRGGTYVDSATTLEARDAFATAISGANWQYYVYGNGNGTHAFNGTNYYTLAEYDSGLTITRTVVADSADFGGGTINGAVTQFVVVPEPGALAIALTGIGGFIAWAVRQRSRRLA